MTETDRNKALEFSKRLNERFSELERKVAKTDAETSIARSVFMPGTNVEVDTGPIAAVVQKFSEHMEAALTESMEKFSEGFDNAFSQAINGLVSSIGERLMDKMDMLIQALVTRPGITFAPQIQPSEVRTIVQTAHAPEVKVDVQPTPVTVQPSPVPAITFPERPKRTLRMQHPDGSESVIREE